ncbi:pilus assembly protein CpaE [Plantibacter flavus]
MISAELARALRTAGLRWTPEPGDRFTIDGGELAGDVFTVSEMTVEVHEHPGGRSFGFNGTTEWALDSVEQEDTLWLPSEHQLRALLRGSFRSLERAASGPSPAGAVADTAAADPFDDELDVLLSLGDGEAYTVTVEFSGEPRRFSAATAPDAYATALLELILRSVA